MMFDALSWILGLALGFCIGGIVGYNKCKQDALQNLYEKEKLE